MIAVNTSASIAACDTRESTKATPKVALEKHRITAVKMYGSALVLAIIIKLENNA